MSEPSPGPLATEPAPAHWRDPASYDAWLLRECIEPLRRAAAQPGGVPRPLQWAVLQRVHWYFTVDARERAPTMACSAEMSGVFHQRMRELMQHIDAAELEAPTLEALGTEVRHALLSYKSPQPQCAPTVDAYDHEQGLARISYYLHGAPPDERFVVDGRPVQPAYAKYRGCRYFHRLLLRQRIAWVPVAGAAALGIELAGRAVPVALGPQPFSLAALPAPSAPLALQCVRAGFAPGKAHLQQPLPVGWAGWKVRLVKALARLPLVRRRFADAWVFVDRDEDADDNAEHLYRWVREHHPEINAWYLLRPDAAAWPRLQAEGFRLLPPGLQRRLLALNCKHIVSSHTGQEFGLDPARYGDMMRWRYTFLRHGVMQNELSHWWNPSDFNGLLTASPAEQQAVVGDDSAYIYTQREARCTGFPRHDRLLRIARQAPCDAAKLLLVLPTWRSNLVDERMNAGGAAARLQAVSQSVYAQQWRAFLNAPELASCLQEHGWRMAFVPHTNAMPYLDAFAVPRWCEVHGMGSGGIQELLASTALFVTDYTSVAFDIALLRRSIVYFQFDRREFYAGGHNWRPGYFDYDRDGLGPVAFDLSQAVRAAIEAVERAGRPDDRDLARMVQAMPGEDELACRRGFETIKATTQAWQSRGSGCVSPRPTASGAAFAPCAAFRLQ